MLTPVHILGKPAGLFAPTGKLDCRKLLMCLRSGLLCEQVWALDALTILMHDDSMVLQFSLDKMPGLLDLLLYHYRKALAAMFDELTDLCGSESSINSHANLCSNDGAEPEISDSSQLLSEENFTWVTRSGLPVMLDESDGAATTPLPSVYSWRRPYRVSNSSAPDDCVVVSFYETEGTVHRYKSQFKPRLSADSGIVADSDSDTVVKDDDATTLHSPAPTSHTSAGTEFSTQSEKRLAPDGGVGQFPVCACDIKTEHSCDSVGKGLLLESHLRGGTGPKKEAELLVKQEETTLTQPEGDPELQTLEMLEAKLSSSRKRR